MRIRRLGWAGVEIESQGTRLAIDPLATLGFFEQFWGPEAERDRLVQLEAGSLDGVLLTHFHRDHADPEAIAAAAGTDGVVAGPPRIRFVTPQQQYSVAPQEDALSELGVERLALSAGESLQLGELTATACHSADGVGANQVAWLVSDGEASVLHCGDTLWHGMWWELAAEHGSPDLVCLPANGVEVSFPFNQPYVGQAADMNPEQAVDAAYALGAGRLMPIHFNGTYSHPEIYRPTDNVTARLEQAAASRGVDLAFPEIGSWLAVVE